MYLLWLLGKAEAFMIIFATVLFLDAIHEISLDSVLGPAWSWIFLGLLQFVTLQTGQIFQLHFGKCNVLQFS